MSFTISRKYIFDGKDLEQSDIQKVLLFNVRYLKFVLSITSGNISNSSMILSPYSYFHILKI